MNYKIPGNNNYQIDEKREITRIDGHASTLKSDGDKIYIELYGYGKNVEKEWLYWLAYFKLELPKEYRHHIFNFIFKDNGALKHIKIDKKIVLFKEPVYLIDKKDMGDYMLIARFPNYAVKYDGTIYNLKYKKILPVRKREDEYVRTAIVDQADLYARSPKTLHRIVAHTYIKNAYKIDFVKYPLIDHKDGDKTNCHYTNLRFMSYKQNNKAAVDQGLRSDSKAIKIRDVYTGEIKNFDCTTDAAIYMERSKFTFDSVKDKHKIFRSEKGDFEIKLLDDKTKWFYEDTSKIFTTNQKVRVTIEKEDGTKLVLNNLADFIQKVFDGKKSADSVQSSIELYKKRYPKDKVCVLLLNNYVTETLYVARNVDTCEEHKFTNRKELETYTGISKSCIQKSISNRGAYQYGSWIFKKDQDIWNDLVHVTNKQQTILLKNIETKEEKVFKSLRSVSAFIGYDKKTIKNMIEHERIIKNKFILKYDI